MNFSSGNPPLLFETSTDLELVGGTMFAGTFSTPPSVGLSINDVLSNFDTFDALDGLSLDSGFFVADAFSGDVEPDFSTDKIYLVITDTSSIATATEFAVISSSDTSWAFPLNDTSASTASITLAGFVDEVYAGSPDTISNPGGIPGNFNTIQLEVIPEPSASILLILASVLFSSRRKR